MREYIKRILSAWYNGKPYATSGSGSGYCGSCSMTLQGNMIYSYSTLIAIIQGKTMYLNEEKYSATTSRQQSNLASWGSGRYGLTIERVSPGYLEDMARKMNK